MGKAWDREDFLDFHYSRMAVRELMRRTGISSRRHIGNLDKRAHQVALDMKYQPPEIEMGSSLLPVVIHNAWD